MKKHLQEIKARAADLAPLRQTLRDLNADFRGRDHQVDHYFTVPTGRLKLRSGTIEQSLIYYQRPDQAAAKQSRVHLTRLPDRATAEELAGTLTEALGRWVTVDKKREIYFIDNVKFHLDEVVGLGTFVEVEAIGESKAEAEVLLGQCRYYKDVLGIREEDLVDRSYSDLLGEGS